MEPNSETQNLLKMISPHVEKHLENNNQQDNREHEEQMLMIKLKSEADKMRVLGESEYDKRNKIFIGVALFIVVTAVTVLACFGKLNDGLLSLFSVLIGSLFTAYASGLNIIGKDKPGKKSE